MLPAHEQALKNNFVELALRAPHKETKELRKKLANEELLNNIIRAALDYTLTSSLRYTFSLLGEVLATFLLRPPALRSIP